jgi:histidine triad (HIT) family protein
MGSTVCSPQGQRGGKLSARFAMEDCIFCKVAEGSIPSKKVAENDQVVAFEDISPQAPTHILIVPRKHISTLNDVTSSDQDLLGAMVMTAIQIAKDRQLSSSGYRLVWNTNRGAGQSVFHIHLHLLGGRAMAWPPG